MQFFNVEGNYTEELKDVWNEHSIFLKTAIKALCGLPEDKFNRIEDGDYSNIEKLNNVINGKDFTHYVIREANGVKSNPLSKNGLIYTLISRFVKKREKTTFQELRETFPQEWRMKPYSRMGTLTN